VNVFFKKNKESLCIKLELLTNFHYVFFSIYNST